VDVALEYNHDYNQDQYEHSCDDCDCSVESDLAVLDDRIDSRPCAKTRVTMVVFTLIVVCAAGSHCFVEFSLIFVAVLCAGSLVAEVWNAVAVWMTTIAVFQVKAVVEITWVDARLAAIGELKAVAWCAFLVFATTLRELTLVFCWSPGTIELVYAGQIRADDYLVFTLTLDSVLLRDVQTGSFVPRRNGWCHLWLCS